MPASPTPTPPELRVLAPADLRPMRQLLDVFGTAFDEPAADAAPMVATAGQRGVLSINGALILVLGLLPGGLMALCVQAIRSSLSM